MSPEDAIRDVGVPQAALVGFSGGADSTALLLALRSRGWRVTAVHFQHHLRGEAAEADAEWCRGFCAKRKIPFRRVDLHVREAMRPGESVETAARRLRLEAWGRLAEGRPVFLAHHADDCLEELFLRLGRGSNASGLTGLRRERRLANGLTLLRPLLWCRKAELEEYLRGKGVCDWRVDATNAECGCRRNAIRNRLLPLAREVLEGDSGMLASLEALGEDAAYIEGQASAWLEAHPSPTSAEWAALAPAVQVRALRRYLGLPVPPSRATLGRIRGYLGHRSGTWRAPLGGGRTLLVEAKGLRLVPEELEPLQELTWNWRRAPRRIQAGMLALDGEGVSERFAASALPGELTVRGWRAGDRMRPFGGTHHRKLQDLFTDAGLLREWRAGWPVVLAGDEIIWVPGVCRAEFGPVADGEAAVRLAFSQEEEP